MRISRLFLLLSASILTSVFLIPLTSLAETRSTVDVRVLSIFHPKEVTVTTPSDAFRITLEDGKMHINGKRNAMFFSALPSTVSIPGKIRRTYRGTIKIYQLLSELVIVNRVPIDAYLASIVGAEMGDAPQEAQKAQAIVSRTYLFGNLKRHEQFDFCDLTHCQVYKGTETETEESRNAVSTTAGMFLYHNGKIAEVYYHSTCGSKTADYSSIFEGENEAMVSVCDSNFCEASPHYAWEWQLPVNEAPFRELTVSKRGNDGRVIEVLVDGNPEQGWKFRMRIAKEYGWSTLKSSWFSVEKKDDHFLFTGHGLGHGLGMCQWGAKKLAQEGKTAVQILHHYFPNLNLQTSN